MRKPHWELLKSGELISKNDHPAPDQLLEMFRGIRVVGTKSLGVQVAYIRRALTGRGLGVDADEVGRITSSHPLDPNELVGDLNLGNREGMTSEQWISYTQFAVYCLFFQGGQKIYKIAREFGEQLAKVNLDIKASLVPAFPTAICIEFPESVRFFDDLNGDYFHCAYILSERRSQEFTPVDGDGVDVEHCVTVVLPCYDEAGNLKNEENNLTLTFRSPEETIESSLQRCEERSTHPLHSEQVVRFILKCLVYLQSGDPDLREYRAPRAKTENPKKLRRFVKEHANQSMVDMTLVGFSFKKPRTYLVNEVAVTGHFRWQPYGTHRDKVKLIWIEPHVRHYGSQESNDERDSTENQSPSNTQGG